MSEYDDSDEYQDDVDGGPAGLREIIRKQEAKAREAEARAAAAERELAFAKAGLPTDDPRIGYFVKGYEGEVKPEAIRAAAESAGFLAPLEPANTVPAEELAQHQQAAALASGGSVGPPDEDGEYLTKLGQARSRDEILALMRQHGSPITSDL